MTVLAVHLSLIALDQVEYILFKECNSHLYDLIISYNPLLSSSNHSMKSSTSLTATLGPEVGFEEIVVVSLIDLAADPNLSKLLHFSHL